MLFAKKSNRIQPINEVEAQKYLSLGYDIVNNQGDVVYEAVPNDVTLLKAAFNRHAVQIAELKTALKLTEEQFALLKADYDVLNKEYLELKASQEKASTRKPRTTKKAEE